MLSTLGKIHVGLLVQSYSVRPSAVDLSLLTIPYLSPHLHLWPFLVLTLCYVVRSIRVIFRVTYSTHLLQFSSITPNHHTRLRSLFPSESPSVRPVRQFSSYYLYSW
jgi:hypothetical protein